MGIFSDQRQGDCGLEIVDWRGGDSTSPPLEAVGQAVSGRRSPGRPHIGEVIIAEDAEFDAFAFETR